MRCGLRIGDALRLPRDCMIRDADGAPYLRYFNHKMDREALVPIDEELEHAIGSQHQRLHDRWPQGTALLFPRATGNPDGCHPMGDQNYRRALRRWLKRCDIRNEHGQPVHLTPHQWRHTLGTQLKVSGVASGASFGTSREYALPAVQRAALRCRQLAGRHGGCSDLGLHGPPGSDATMMRLMLLRGAQHRCGCCHRDASGCSGRRWMHHGSPGE
jgi:integrase